MKNDLLKHFSAVETQAIKCFLTATVSLHSVGASVLDISLTDQDFLEEYGFSKCDYLAAIEKIKRLFAS